MWRGTQWTCAGHMEEGDASGRGEGGDGGDGGLVNIKEQE